MARPGIGTIIQLQDDKGGIRYIQSRADTWANKALAADLDRFHGEKNDELITWFDQGADVIRKRVKRG